MVEQLYLKSHFVIDCPPHQPSTAVDDILHNGDVCEEFVVLNELLGVRFLVAVDEIEDAGKAEEN